MHDAQSSDESTKEQQNHDLRGNGQPERMAKKNDGGETKTRLLNWEPYLAAKTQY